MKYPYNLLYWDGTTWWCDCSNLLKALFNGRDINDKTPGKFEESTEKTGDVNSNGLIKKCHEISNDFSELREGEPRLIHMNGHIGAYLGKEIDTNHGICNVVESTSAWKRGIQFSYVDKYGKRLYGINGEQKGTWARHGKPSDWVLF